MLHRDIIILTIKNLTGHEIYVIYELVEGGPMIEQLGHIAINRIVLPVWFVTSNVCSVAARLASIPGHGIYLPPHNSL